MTTTVGNGFIVTDWKVVPPDGIRRKTVKIALLWVAPDDGYSIWCLSLPGAGSQGDTPEEAIKNIREAIAGCVESYEADGEEIPWAKDHEIERPRGVEIIGILVELPEPPDRSAAA